MVSIVVLINSLLSQLVKGEEGENLGRTYSMAKLDLKLEEAGTCATNPSQYWLADLPLFQASTREYSSFLPNSPRTTIILIYTEKNPHHFRY
jgi:hypothetical protein